MKLSKSKTEWILVYATSQSEWDNTNCCLIQVQDNLLQQIKDADKALKVLEEKYPSAYKITFWDPVTFLDLSMDEVEEDIAEVIENEHWCFVETTLEEIGILDKPESKISAEQLCITGNRTIYWKAYGEYTSEQFWTGRIGIGELEKAYNSILETVNN